MLLQVALGKTKTRNSSVQILKTYGWFIGVALRVAKLGQVTNQLPTLCIFFVDFRVMSANFGTQSMQKLMEILRGSYDWKDSVNEILRDFGLPFFFPVGTMAFVWVRGAWPKASDLKRMC